ncbi:MAG: hypothetical protein ACJ786_15600 [Catenulispora sp.]
MLTTDDLRDAMAAAVDDPAAEAYTIGLSDRALAEAGGRAARRWVRLVPGVAVGTAFVVAGTFGVLALGGGAGGGKQVNAMSAPAAPANRLSESALLDFEVECLNGQGPKMAMDWVWDPETQQYRAVDGSVYTSFTPSPDGKRALVLKGTPAGGWAVADWADAVAGRVTFHPITDGVGLRWTADGKELTTVKTWGPAAKKDGSAVITNKSADFYDPAMAAKRSVPLPQAVLDRAAGGQWQLQEWQGGHDAVVFPMVSTAGDRVEWLDAQGKVLRTVALQNPLRAAPHSVGSISSHISPDGRYLAEDDGKVLATFDLQAGGRRLGETPIRGGAGESIVMIDSLNPWNGNDEIVLRIDPAAKPTPPEPKTGHSPIYRVLSHDMKVVEETKFVLPDDPRGYCASWEVTWAPKTQFPGAFVP